MLTKNKQQIKILIVITGSPGVGKSTLAKYLAKKLKLDRLDLHYYYKRVSTGYNRSKQSYDIDNDKFQNRAKEKLMLSKKGLIIDSHSSHLLPRKLVDICIALTCSNLKKLKTRLRKRNYSKKKIKENLDAEIFQICLMEAKEKRHTVLVFDVAEVMDKNKILNQVNKLL